MDTPEILSDLPPIVGTANIVEGNDFVLPPCPPLTYLGMARLLLNGVQPLATSGASCSVALAFIAGQVLECALKAYLSRDGGDKRLKGDPDIRHNLEALWHLAQAEGLPLPAQPPEWVLTLSGLHNKPYFIRYSTGVHALITPAAEPMAAELEAIVALVPRHLQFVSPT
jgi:hypothetical protein